jgi:hypothetical protein
MKYILFFTFVLIVSGSCFADPLSILTVKGKKISLSVEIADTEKKHKIGLMNRDNLFPYDGMLFVFQKPIPVQFWMKDTKISLDVVFIGEDGVIKAIKYKAKPGDLTPIPAPSPVLAVLEIEGGQTKTLGISTGDTVIHTIFEKDLK